MRILCDIDGVMADCLKHWINLLNRYHNEGLIHSDITEWDVHPFCKNATPQQVYGFLNEPGFFLHLDPIPGAVETVQKFIADGHEVVFVTACTHGHKDKRTWLQRHLPDFDLKNLIFAERKELVHGDVLIDDRPLNLRAWQKAHPDGTAICFAHPYNKEYQGPRYKTWNLIYIALHFFTTYSNSKPAMAGKTTEE